MTARGVLVYFMDENTLGMGKLLRRAGRDDILYPAMWTYLRYLWAPQTSIGCRSLEFSN